MERLAVVPKAPISDGDYRVAGEADWVSAERPSLTPEQVYLAGAMGANMLALVRAAESRARLAGAYDAASRGDRT
jgi:hypothetical protein